MDKHDINPVNQSCLSQPQIGNMEYRDVIVNDMIILELKSVRKVIKAHEVQLVNYLVATGKPVGLILNFRER